MHKTKIVIRRTDGHSSSVRLPTLAPYPSTGHSSVDRVVRPYEPPPLLTTKPDSTILKGGHNQTPQSRRADKTRFHPYKF